MQNTVRNLVIIGAGDFGREVAALVKRINEASSSIRYSILGFIDDNEALMNKEIADIRVIGDTAWLNEYKDGKLYAVCAIGFGSTRKKVIEKVQNSNVVFPVLIDPAATFLGDVNIGEVRTLIATLSLGDLEVSSISEYLSIESDLGKISLDKVSLTKDSSITLSLGDLDINHLSNAYVDAKTDLGDIDILDNDREAPYTLTIKNDLGDVSIG